MRTPRCRKQVLCRVAALLVVAIALFSCSSDGHDAVFDGGAALGERRVPGEGARQAGEPAELARSAGEPGDEGPITPVIHVLGNIRQLENTNTQWQDSVPVISADATTIATLGCDVRESTCADSAIAEWATGRVEILNVATLAAADAGVDDLERAVQVIGEGGLEVVGFGDTAADAVAPVVIGTNSFRIAVHAISLVVDGAIAAGPESPGIAGAASFDLLLDAVNTSRLQGYSTIVLIDWGDTDRRSPSAEQISHVQQLIDRGVEAVVGSGADYLQRFDRVANTTVAYSLGNAATNSPDALRHDSAILRLEFDLPGQSCLLPTTATTAGPVLDHPDQRTCG